MWSLIIREMLNKITMRHYTFIRIATTKHEMENKIMLKRMWRYWNSVDLWWEHKMVQPIKETVQNIKNRMTGTSLVAQWLTICLPMRGTWVRALVWEDPTCRRATKPVYHNYWACALEPANHNYWAHVLQLLKPMCLEPVLCNKRSHRNEKPTHHNKE